MATDILKQFESLHYRRTLLESLAQLSCQLHGASEGLAAVQHIMRPSQQFAASLRERLHNEVAFYHARPEAELRTTLLQLNAQLDKACSLFLRIARLDDETFINNFQASEEQRQKFKLLQQKLNSFQQQTQHYLAIRMVLHDRGLQLDAVKLTPAQGVLDQESLAQELDGLRAREKVQRKRFTQEVSSLLADTELLMTVARNNSEVLASLSQNAQQLRSALVVLQSGGDVQLLPGLVEDIVCDILPEGFVPDPIPDQAPATQQNQPLASSLSPTTPSSPVKPTQRPNGLFTRMRIWFSTDWDISWKETKYYPHKK